LERRLKVTCNLQAKCQKECGNRGIRIALRYWGPGECPIMLRTFYMVPVGLDKEGKRY
jgi:hypothetical protein